MKKHILTWLIGCACALAMASSYHLDEPVDAELSKDMAAAKHCRETHGETGYTWNTKGDLVCLPKISKMYRNPKK